MAARWSFLLPVAAAAAAVASAAPAGGGEDAGRLDDPLNDGLVSASGDPLVDWLAGLKIHLSALTVEQDGFTLTASNLNCEQLSVERVQSAFTSLAGGDPQRPGVAFDVSGIGLRCVTDYRVDKWGFLHASGNLVVQVQPQKSSAKLTLALPLEGNPVPTRMVIDACSADVDLSLQFSGGILPRIINMFTGLIASQVKSQVNSKGCQMIRDMAAKNGTAALAKLNCFMLPDEEAAALGYACAFGGLSGAPRAFEGSEGGLQAPMEEPAVWATPLRLLREAAAAAAPRPWQQAPAAAAGLFGAGDAGPPVDLRRVSAIHWASWALKDLVGVKGMRRIAKWATHGSGNATVPGGDQPIFSKRVAQGSSTSILDVSVYLAGVGIHGLDALASFEPLAARSPTELDIGLGLGTEEKPGVGVWAHLVLRLHASDTSGLVPPSMVESNYSFNVGLDKPSLSTTLKVLVDSAKLQAKKMLAQLYFDPANCTKDYLISAPEVQRLNVTFAGVSEKLDVHAETEGALEVDLAEAINRVVELFNAVYLPFLPGAISRQLASRQGLGLLNELLAASLAPAHCMGEDAAMEKAGGMPSVEDWRPLLAGKFRKAIDAVADGFIAQNSTDIQKALRDLPAVNITTGTGMELSLSAQRLHFGGMDQFRMLRLLLPDATDPRALKNRVSIACPGEAGGAAAAAASWRPGMALHGALAAGGIRLPGMLELVAPCGNMEFDMDAVLDMQALLALPAPFPASCAFRAVNPLSIKNVSVALKDLGDFLIGPESGPLTSPMREMCNLFPSLCAFSRGLAGKVDLETLFDMVRTKALDVCSKELGDDAFMAAAEQGTKEPWMLQNSAGLWAGALAATVALAGVGAAVGTRPARRASGASMCAELYAAGLDGSKPKVYAHAVVVLVTTALSLALVLRILACFALPVAVAHVDIDIGPLGSDVESLELITFTGPSLVLHFCEAGAYFAALLVAAGQAFSFLVINLLLWVWLTPVFRTSRRLIVRIALWLNRFVIVDIVFFAHMIPAMNVNLQLPLEVTVRLDTKPGFGICPSGISNLLCIACCLELLRLQSLSPVLAREAAVKIEEARAERPGKLRKLLMAARATCGVLVVAGLLLWTFCAVMEAEWTGLVGMVFPEATFRGLDLSRLTFGGAPFLGFFMFLGMLASAVQGIMPFVVRLQGRQHSDHLVVKCLREFSDALSVPDVLLASYLAFVLNVDDVVRWIIHNKFPDIVDAVQQYVEIEAVGLAPSVKLAGLLGMVLGMMGSFGVGLSNAKADIAFIFMAGNLDPAFEPSGSLQSSVLDTEVSCMSFPTATTQAPGSRNSTAEARTSSSSSGWH